VNDEGYGYFSEFEILTSTALLYFKERLPDIVILETGIGGKMDMTNVILNPLVSVITQIGFDHVDMLGDTLAKIAEAKAGIIKEGVP
ncbi:bifunctional folylpolyglutamate synthase/dihydrofolate synthase, partial [Mycobacterium tuberculosis]|nr:bifunctional folylpolyglutamate synthase/dihydrofolate synthase [Mycobacterium tuberculosis]